MDAAIQQSAVEYSSMDARREQSKQRITKQLHCNGLKEIQVERDGNCLFNAITTLVKANNPLLTPLNLREAVCHHMMEHSETYEQWVTGNFKEELEELAIEGRWNVSIGNAVPYALSNLFQSNIIIYTDMDGLEVMNIEPTLDDSTHPQANEITQLHLSF